MTSEEVPILRSVEDVATSEDRMRDELSAVRQSVDPALSEFLHHVWLFEGKTIAREAEDRDLESGKEGAFAPSPTENAYAA